jgi:hypothetical protein|tara:strand:+ start:2917 stop:3069 length:153 start_codon:yes stop_codon:yes gene_type:complete
MAKATAAITPITATDKILVMEMELLTGVILSDNLGSRWGLDTLMNTLLTE